MQGRQYMGARANDVRFRGRVLVRELHIECNPKADVVDVRKTHYQSAYADAVDVRKTHYQSAYGKSTVVM